VDVVSPQLSLALSAGSTRVVRAVGVNINVALGELVKLAAGANRKLEKIIDTYVPGCVSQTGHILNGY
jgi:transcriptional accessory protein Tex/SPT6